MPIPTPALPSPDHLLHHLEPPGPIRAWERVDYPYGSPTTGGLFRLRGNQWSWFCKVLNHVRHWPTIAFLPADVAQEFTTTYPWRLELEMWAQPWAGTLPDGLRLPQLHGIVELGDDRVAVWMEDVEQDSSPWELDRYIRAARRLGQWNARTSASAFLDLNPFRAGHALRKYAEHRVLTTGSAMLEDEGLWRHPWLHDHGGLRTDLRRLITQVPQMLQQLDTYTQAIPHGDASPQNLLVPAAQPETFVVIDVSFRSPHALGFDLGQLLVGLTHAGTVPTMQLPAIAAAIAPAYIEGLTAEGITVPAAEVRNSFVTGALLRSGFDGFLLDLLGSEDLLDRHTFDERIALSRFLVDQYDTCT